MIAHIPTLPTNPMVSEMARRIHDARESRVEAGVMGRTLGALRGIGKGNVAIDMTFVIAAS